MSLNRKRSVLLGVGLAVILALVVTISVVFTQKEVRVKPIVLVSSTKRECPSVRTRRCSLYRQF